MQIPCAKLSSPWDDFFFLHHHSIARIVTSPVLIPHLPGTCPNNKHCDFDNAQPDTLHAPISSRARDFSPTIKWKQEREERKVEEKKKRNQAGAGTGKVWEKGFACLLAYIRMCIATLSPQSNPSYPVPNDGLGRSLYSPRSSFGAPASPSKYLQCKRTRSRGFGRRPPPPHRSRSPGWGGTSVVLTCRMPSCLITRPPSPAPSSSFTPAVYRHPRFPRWMSLAYGSCGPQL